MADLFITGGTGFLGCRLLPLLAHDRRYSIAVLSRDKNLALKKLPTAPNVQIVEADLGDPDRYRSALNGCRTVLHLAATTGTAGVSDYYRVNAAGTKILLNECAKAGVGNFLHISSIAVKFPEKKHYHYARAKEQGEAAVRQWGRSYTILRPTIIIGKGSPALAGLARLAGLPRPLVFGSGETMVQPIFVADLALAIREILSTDRFNGETLELGGRQSLPIEDFMMRIRAHLNGTKASAIHWPLTPTIHLLGVLEKFFPSILPLRAGQLYSFRFDGRAAANDLFARLSPHFLEIEPMLAESFRR